MNEKVKKIVNELDQLQNVHYGEYEEALYFKNRYHEYRAKYQKIEDEIDKKLEELRKLDPNYEYEVDLY